MSSHDRSPGVEHVIEGAGYRAVITEAGATLRELTFQGRHLIVGLARGEMCTAGRGQQLIPWPNRIRDGRYRFDGRDLQLPLSEPALHNASHGLTRWVAWSAVTRENDHTLRMIYPLQAQPGYPWNLGLTISYQVTFSGLAVTAEAHNVSGTPAPYAYGAHPYLTAGSDVVDDDRVALTAGTRLLTDPDRLLPTGTESVRGTAYDFDGGRRIGDLQLNDAFGDLSYAGGRATVSLTAPGGQGVELWGTESVRWFQLFTADGVDGLSRRGLAVEPMTAPPDAFNSGTDLAVIGRDEVHRTEWGIRAL